MGVRKVATIAARSLIRDKPHHAQWLITKKCNYKCLGCNVWEEQDKNELSTEEIKRGMDILKEAGIIELVISGGDPLLRDDIGEIIDYATERFVTTVYDNGSMAAKKIENLRKVDFVALSIDSLNEKTHDYIKNVPGAWKNAMETVETLQKENIKVSISLTISQINLNEIADITNYFTNKDISVWYALYSYDTTQDPNQLFRIGKSNEEFIIKDKAAMVKLCDTLMEMKKTNKRILITNRILKAIKSLYAEEKRTWNCKALQSFLVVDHLGRIAGCHNHTFAGSIFDLPKNWKSEKYNTLREKYKNCTQCTYLCYIFYSLYGTPSTNLSLAKEQWKNASLLLKK
ncbi:MAG: radical SAM protein [Candidatus Bathyarchaeota archaeon]|uniref:radical SAM protein n=1 Tax=Candidatus Bathycorpusculum sp. TaxID=2994959 RepID=UPI002826E4FE|nr:radical SAM protein [Candidatus Termiticorpusculum sp.]MCL2257283.1 radical SAM protein [Candidatus Termiticorpusculum sp.]MCL2292581.1 radical SAM protein [Candidatus Termiticorpusculum sp.]